MNQSDKLVPVDILALIQDQSSKTPIVVLHDRVGNRLLPIWIGEPEARAIDLALNNVATPRPLTHKLALKIVEHMGGALLRVVVDRIKQHTYYASVYVQTPKDAIKIDARPSDAIALALEARVPIFVVETVMKDAAQPSPLPNMPQKDILSTQIRQQGNLKKEFSQEEAARLKELLEKAREREQKSDNTV